MSKINDSVFRSPFARHLLVRLRDVNYLSDAAGFIIVLETKVEGKVDAWSNQPMTKAEAVDLLNSVLNKNGYTALVNGRGSKRALITTFMTTGMSATSQRISA